MEMIRRKIWMAVCAVMVCAAAWGQLQNGPVTGDLYRSTDKSYKAELVNIGEQMSNAQDALDGNQETSYAFANVRGSIVVKLPDNSDLSSISILGGSFDNYGTTPTYVRIYISDASGARGTQINNNNTSWGYGDTYTITIPTSYSIQYIRFDFEKVYDYWGNNYIAIREILFEGVGLAKIKHKPAKWHDLRASLGLSDAAKAMDTFNDDEKMFAMPKNGVVEGIVAQEDIQAAHTSVDTIYMNRGTRITLELPDKQTTTLTSMRTYQRWYSFRTGKTFRTRNTSGVIDLLTPASGQPTPYRFENGYVGRPMIDTNYGDDNGVVHSMDFYFPTQEEYEDWFSAEDRGGIDGNWFVVACDVSGYTDFTEKFDVTNSKNSTFAPNYIEPTLSHRFIYYICATDNPNSWYKKALDKQTNGTDKTHYLEEYEINMPAVRIPNKTSEVITLSKDAQSFAIPNNNETLTVTKIEDDAKITLETTSLSGTDRVIKFSYPAASDLWGARTENVADGSSATIVVTKGDYRIAKYKLNFKAENSLMTQTMVEQIGTSEDGWKKYTFRKPETLNNSYQLLTELNFDYDATVAATYGQEQVYPYPLEWGSSSYGFYDGGSTVGDFKSQRNFPQWGYYAIVNNYVERGKWAWGNHDAITVEDYKPLKNSSGANSTYHIFVDASDRPGVIARLPFDAELCQGSELFVSAWVKCARWANSSENAAMLFTIMGVTADGKDVPIYRHQTGQIPTTYLNDRKVTLPGFSQNEAHDKNEWMQVYFSFLNNQNIDFDSYVLQVENNSASTDGGDMYLDDVRVYMATVRAIVEQLSPSCIGDNTPLRMRINWERLLSRTGGTEGLDANAKIKFCFVDKLEYDQAVASGTAEATAIENAQVPFFWTEDGSDSEVMVGTLKYNLTYDSNEAYDKDAPTTNTGENFYAYKDETGKYLAIDLWASELIPTRHYYLAIDVAGNENFQIVSEDNPCAISTEFMVESSTLIRMNGEVVEPETDFCAGQVFNFTAQLRMDDGTEDGQLVTEAVYFDWYFGSVDEYLDKGTRGFSLDDALRAFRDIEAYKGLETITDEVRPSGELNEDMINYLKELSTTSETTGELNAPLVLHKQNLNVTLLKSGLNLVLRPIQITIEGESDNAQICWSYVPLTLTTNDKAPHASAGFGAFTYPDNYEAALRMGYKQITSNRELIINLRNISYATEEATGLQVVSPTSSAGGNVSGSDLSDIFLVATNDPEMKKFIERDGFQEYDLPIGKVTGMTASESNLSSTATVKFDLSRTSSIDNMTEPFQFKPREGYEYTFNIHFEEVAQRDPNEDDAIPVCYGKIPITMKVVPEYLVWDDQQKTADGMTGNWNNDGNWRRATNDELKKNGTSTYPTEGNTSGFVPMLFSKVIMPKDSKVKLYAAGFSGSGNNISWAGDENKPKDVGDPTPNIQYDLMVFEHQNEKGMKTERYRVSLCDQIHFEPGAEMLYPEYLLYNKAWVDYELTKGDWHLLSSPLKDVVAGDFYTDNTGEEAQEYFTPITFDGNASYDNSNQNSRFSPTVYQRGWKNETTEVPLQMDASDIKNVAIKGNWSSVYNNVAERYEPGAGFSLKVQGIDQNTAKFRLPKGDDTYYYYTQGSNKDNGQTIERTNSYRLSTDDIYRRVSGEASYSESITKKSIEIPLSDYESAKGDLYLIGNPFISHLDMNLFLSKNTGVIEPKYWAVEDGIQNIAAVTDNDKDWISTTGASVPTIAPLRSFFVKKAANAAKDAKITFTADMQTLAESTTGTSTNALLLTATTQDGRQSRAAISYDAAASETYEASEDAELFLDSNLGDLPMVYTAAGTMAASINRTSGLYNIPVGVYAPGAKGETVSLTFSGVDGFSYATLYDAETRTESPIHEGSRFTVPANTAGRYFLRAGVPTANEAVQESAIRIYTVGGGTLVVASTDLLRTVRVYDFAGRLVANETGLRTTQCRIELPEGSYIVKAESERGEEEVKIRM